MIENKLIDNNKYGFINRLEELRLQLGYTKVELAEYLDVYKSLVSLVYANKRSITQNFYDKLVEKKFNSKEEINVLGLTQSTRQKFLIFVRYSI